MARCGVTNHGNERRVVCYADGGRPMDPARYAAILAAALERLAERG